MLARALGALFVLAALALCFGELGDGSIWNTDDALYGHVVRQLLSAHRWSAPQWFDYDLASAYPLGVTYMAAIARVAGGDLFGLRLSAALAALAGVLVFVTLPDRAQRATGIAAGALLIAQPLFFLLGQRVMHDTLLAALTIAAIALFTRGLERAHGPSLIAAGTACAAASLVKIGAGLLPLAVMGIHVLAFARPVLRRRAPWIGLAIALGVPLGWLAVHDQIGPILGSLLQRIFVGFEGHGAAAAGPAPPPTSSLVATLLDQGPAGLVLLALAAAGVVVALRRRDVLDRLALVWLLAAAIAISAMRTYLPQYALQVILPLCLVSGLAVAEGLRRAPVLSPLGVLLLLALLAPLAAQRGFVHHADDRVAALAHRQAEAPSDALLCTVDVYHAASVYYTGRKVLYLTEHERARRILRRVFGEVTVPTLATGDLPRLLDQAPAVSCIVERQAAAPLLTRLTLSYRVIEPPAGMVGPDVVLIER